MFVKVFPNIKPQHFRDLLPVEGEHDQSIARDSQSANDEDEEGDDVVHMIRDVQSFEYQPMGLHHQTQHQDPRTEEQHFNKVSANSVMFSRLLCPASPPLCLRLN